MAAVFPSKFLEAIFSRLLPRRGLGVEIRCIPRDADGPLVRRFYRSLSKFKKGWKEITKLNSRGYNIYLGVLPRDLEDDHKLPRPLILTCLWADIDVGADKPNKTFEDALKRIRKLVSRPTIIVKSGHGVHAYWCLKKPATLEPSEAKELLQSLAEKTGGDLQFAEVTRLLRLPGTVNWKKD